MAQVLEQASAALSREIRQLQNQLKQVGDTFASTLLKSILQEYQDIIRAYEEKTEEIQRCQHYAEELDSILARL